MSLRVRVLVPVAGTSVALLVAAATALTGCSAAEIEEEGALGSAQSAACALEAPSPATAPPVDSGICEVAAMAVHLRAGQSDLVWDQSRSSCYSLLSTPGGNEIAQVDEQLLAVDDASRAYESRAQRCFDLKETQRLCRAKEAGEAVSSCIHGFEIDCRRAVSPFVEEAICQGRAPAQAVASRCADVTVGGVGYPDEVPSAQRIGECLAHTPAGADVTSCTFLGQTVTVEQGYCDRLNFCVEPALARLYGLALPAAGRTVRFPSTGDYEIKADLSCSRNAASWSNHNPSQSCRAIDFNVATNYGNLRANSRMLPVADIPPELVAVMEGCGLVWGGRFNGAEGLWNGCDPMHFDYAPECTGACEPRTCVATCVRDGHPGGACVGRDACRCAE